MTTPAADKKLESCRICKSKNLIPYFDFKEMPLANRNLSLPELSSGEPKFPLQLLFCKDCGLSQLSMVVSAQFLYEEYPYRSSISQTFQKHCKEIVENLTHKLALKPNSLIVEIASNDGCLLSKFIQAGFQAIGVEPSRVIADEATAKGLPTLCRFWGKSTALQIQREFGTPQLIIGTNVLAHVDNLNAFLDAVNTALAADGYFVFEVPYMVNYIETLEFDTTYHEHLSYFLLSPLKHILESAGFRIIDVEKLNIHCGSIRVIACKKDAAPVASKNVDAFLAMEKSQGFLKEDIYLGFVSRIERLREDLRKLLSSLKQGSKRIAAYGASAKGNVLLNYCGINQETIDYIIDDTPLKQNKFQSGTHIPIVDKSYLVKARPDYLLILARNFSEEIISKTSEYQQAGGHYIIPLPDIKVIESPYGS